MTSQLPIRRKLVIVGDGTCGKTSLLKFFALGEIPGYFIPTIFERYVTELKLDGQPVELELHDTAHSGQEEYDRLRPIAYSNVHVVLIAFSIDNPDSLENVTEKWAAEVRHYCPSPIPIILVGCKTDLRGTTTQDVSHPHVNQEQAELVAKQIGAYTYKECSVFKNEGVNDIFEAATRASLLTLEPKGSWKCCVVA